LFLANTAGTEIDPAGEPVTLLVGQNSADTTFAGVLSGPGALIKTGVGTLTLNGKNTYTGGTTIEKGILQVRADDNLGAANKPLTSREPPARCGRRSPLIPRGRSFSAQALRLSMPSPGKRSR